MSHTRRQREFLRRPPEQNKAELEKAFMLTNRIGAAVPKSKEHADRIIGAILRRNAEIKKADHDKRRRK